MHGSWRSWTEDRDENRCLLEVVHYGITLLFGPYVDGSVVNSRAYCYIDQHSDSRSATSFTIAFGEAK